MEWLGELWDRDPVAFAAAFVVAALGLWWVLYALVRAALRRLGWWE